MADYEAHFRFDETDGSDDDDDIEKKRERKISSDVGDGGDDALRRASVTSKYSNFAGFGSSEEERESAFEATPSPADKNTAVNQSGLRLNISGFNNCLYSSIRMSCTID